MKIRYSLLIGLALITLSSCRQNKEGVITNHEYYDIYPSDTSGEPGLTAVTDEEFLQYGARVAFINYSGDTIIPFGKYAYYGTDTLIHYANVIKLSNDSTYGRQIAIDRNQRVLFDLVMFDNGPEPFSEGLTRILRNGRMGYANEYGQIVIPCIYDYATHFENGKAQVTFDAVEYNDIDEHRRVESDEWLEIDREGKRIKK